MTEPHLVFKRVASQVASSLRVNFGTLMRDWGLGDFLLDEEHQSRVPQEIAARAMEQLSSGAIDLQDQLVFLTVIQFLDETVGRPVEDPEARQRLHDLAHITQSVRGYDAFLRWARTWYPQPPA